MIKYFQAKDSTNFVFMEHVNLLTEYLKQISDCHELIEETYKMLELAESNDRATYELDIEFYNEEILSLKEGASNATETNFQSWRTKRSASSKTFYKTSSRKKTRKWWEPCSSSEAPAGAKNPNYSLRK